MRSKSEGVDWMIRRAVRDALNEFIANAGATAPVILASNRDHIAQLVADRMTGKYAMLELQDIMSWKKRRGVDG